MEIKMDNTTEASSKKIPSYKFKTLPPISDPLQLASETWIKDEVEICKLQRLNSRQSEIDFKNQQQLSVQAINSNKELFEKEDERSDGFSNPRLDNLNQNKLPSARYMQDLLTFLKEDSNGKGILTAYEKNGKSLTASSRKNLVHTLIQREKDEVLEDLPVGEFLNDWDIGKARFLKLSKEIEATFEGESARTYYIPFCTEQGQRSIASGKLLDHFTYVKKLMRNDGLLISKSRKPSLDQSELEMQSSSTISELEKGDLEFLQNHSEPFEQVKNVFLRSHTLRRNILLLKQMSIFDYMSSVKSLSLNEEGQILINLDFDILHKGKNSMLFEKWPKIRNHLINYLKRVKTSTVEDAACILMLSVEPSDVQDVLIIYLLHYITATDRKKRKRKESFEKSGKKLTSKEKRDPYLLHIEDATELDSTLDELSESLNSKNEKLQPLIVIVGKLRKIQATYVVVNNIKYQTESIIHAVDLSLKIFYVFDCKYPEAIQSLWQFFQGVIYEILSPGEVLTMKNRILKGEIQNILKKSV